MRSVSHFNRWLGWPLILFFVLSCTGQSTEILTLEEESSAPSSYIVTASWDGNNRSVAYYDIGGNYLYHTDFRTEVITPRGLTLLDSETILMSGEGNDSLYTLDFSGNAELFFGSSALNGGIYDLEVDTANDTIYVIESNRIEAFDTSGLRTPAQFINTNTGACTLATPVSMTINTAGNLVVTNIGGTDNVLTYDISTTPPTCLSSVAFGGNPYAVLQHSNGNLYIATQADDEIWQTDIDGSNPVLIWATDTTIINNPQALAELPNGNILVSSAARDSIEQITTTGERVGTIPFIQDSLVNNVGSILVIDGSAE